MTLQEKIRQSVNQLSEQHEAKKQEVIKWLSEVGTFDVVQEVVEQVIKNREQSKIDEE